MVTHYSQQLYINDGVIHVLHVYIVLKGMPIKFPTIFPEVSSIINQSSHPVQIWVVGGLQFESWGKRDCLLLLVCGYGIQLIKTV